MKAIKLSLLILLALAIVGSATLAELEVDMEEPNYLGAELADYTVDTSDGGVFTLSGALKDHDMVFIYLWATWCDNCEAEFPYMQEAYASYGDRVAFIALSVESEDTDEVLKAFAEERGLTFPMGRDSNGLADDFGVYSIPCSVVVDRFGNVAYMAMGGQDSADAFARLFDYFLDDGYTETRALEVLPPAKPDVAAADAQALAEAANVEGGELAFANPTDEYTWPMLPEADGERTALASSNAGHTGSSAAVYAKVEAADGDVLVFDFRTSTEAAMDLLEIRVDDEPVKAFGGSHDWTTWAIDLPEGEHDIAFVYAEDDMVVEGDDRVWIDNVRVATGDEAAALLAQLPAAPAADDFAMRLSGDGVEAIDLDDPDGVMMEYFSCDSYWVVPGGKATLEVDITGDIDSERAFVYDTLTEAIYPLSEMLMADGGGYSVEIDTAALKDSEEGYDTLLFYPGLREADIEGIRGAMLFSDAQTAASILNEVVSVSEDTSDVEDPEEIIWDEEEYEAEFGGDEALEADAEDEADEDGEAVAAVDVGTEAALANGEATYTVTFVDQNGDPVPGCIVNFCTDSACQPVQSDESGVASLTGEPYPYHLQVLKVPEGYTFDVSQEYTAEEAGGSLILVVTKD